MSGLSSKYTIDMVIQDDKARDSLDALSNGLREIEKAAKKSGGAGLLEGVKKTEEATKSLLDELGKQIKDTSLDFKAVSDQFAKNSAKTVGELEKQYSKLRAEQAKGNSAELEAAINVNREMRLKLKLATSGLDEQRREAEFSSHTKAIDEERRRLLNLRFKTISNTLSTLKLQKLVEDDEAETEKGRLKTLKENAGLTLKALKIAMQSSKSNKEAIKRAKESLALHKKQLKEMLGEDKAQAQLLKDTDKENTLLAKKAALLSKIKGGYNGIKIAAKAGAGIVSGAFSAGKSLQGKINAVDEGIFKRVSAVSDIAGKEVEKEQSARRVSGYPLDESKELLGSIHAKTGADYPAIVEAIKSVRAAIGNVNKSDLESAVAVELAYPGAAKQLASTDSEKSAASMNVYANRMRALQKSTGASVEQIQASADKFANMRAWNFKNASVTEMQGVYLALQNSGAFDTEEELDRAFNRFARVQRESGKSVEEVASSFDWSSHIYNQRNRTQAKNTLDKVDWSATMRAANSKDATEMKQTDAERTAEKMRRLEETKNKLLMNLYPVLLPLVEELAGMLQGDGVKQLAKGFTDLFNVVMPLLVTVLKFADQHILRPLKDFICAALEVFGVSGGDSSGDPVANNGKANGGLAFGPTLIGERSFQPEMVLPLDYSRQARANNIMTSVSQTFNMQGNETTALSLSQAVKSRDFRRATDQSAFLLARGGFA